MLQLLFFSCYFVFYTIVKFNRNENTIKIEKDLVVLLDILIRYIFSIFILKVTIFKHHKWSIYAIILGFFLIVPIDIIIAFLSGNIDPIPSLIYIGILFIKAILSPLEHTLIKQLYNDYYILPEYLLFFIGIIETILLLILTPILYFTILKADLTFDIWKIIMSVIYCLISFLEQIITMKIIYIFSSQSVSFLKISTSIAGSIKQIDGFMTKENKGTNKLFDYIHFFLEFIGIIIIIVFGSLVYDEIIIINRCGLNLNVKKGIQERSLSEFESAIIDLEESYKFDTSSENSDDNENN